MDSNMSIVFLIWYLLVAKLLLFVEYVCLSSIDIYLPAVERWKLNVQRGRSREESGRKYKEIWIFHLKGKIFFF